MTNCPVVEKSFLLDFTELQPGDVLLRRPIKPGFLQRLISHKTDSPYTHASIYLGMNQVAEATALRRVRILPLAKAIKNNSCTGVLRSQAKFDGERIDKLHAFINSLIGKRSGYDYSGIFGFHLKNKRYFLNQMEFIRKNCGIYLSAEHFSNNHYFCSSLVVACYSVVGIIDSSAQCAYPHEVISPGDLYKDPTFGWFLGYLLPRGCEVPAEDPLKLMTRWS